MKNNYILLLVFIVLSFNSCSEDKESKDKKIEIADVPMLNVAEATRLAQLPLNCILINWVKP